MSEVFKKLNEINVNDKTEKKGNFTYLSWAFAWGELKKAYPEATAKVYHDDNTNMPYFASKAGIIVKVGITIEGLEHINYLPVMDFKNKTITLEDVNMMDINKAIQRCTTKAIALHGLGLYIYAGEDLPEAPVQLPAFTPKLKMWKQAIEKGTPIETIKTKFSLTEEDEKKYIKELEKESGYDPHSDPNFDAVDGDQY